jgi:hypothetical protein
VHLPRDLVTPRAAPRHLSDAAARVLDETADRLRRARNEARPVILAFGAHAIKNGLGPVLIRLMQDNWLQHLATNGAGVIHDWELAYQGKTSEDVAANVAAGSFGMWEETGFYINLALLLGARDGLGYGEAVGRLIATESWDMPSTGKLLEAVALARNGPEAAERAAAAADLLAALDRFGLKPGRRTVAHPFKHVSAQAAAWELGVPFTAHPMIGHDIIYTHPLNSCAAVGRCAERDLLAFAHSVAQLDGGVYLSIGSAVMSPMIFEKCYSMARNLAMQEGRTAGDHLIVVVDLAESDWDWTRGEPPPDRPEYYQRHCKTFSRMGGTLRIVSADNAAFLLGLCQRLDVEEGAL